MAVYVTHTCKNKKCQWAFMDVDPKPSYRRDLPISNRYCPKCINAGFKQPAKKPTPEAFLKRHEEVRNANS